MTTKRIPLAELGWQTFSRKKDSSEYISLYKAVAVILAREKSLEQYLLQYYKYLDKAEFHAAIEMLDRYDTTSEVLSIDDLTNADDIFNYIYLPELTIFHIEAIKYLDEQRARVCEFIGPPVSIIYALLQSEIEKYKRNKNKSSRHIITKQFEGYNLYYISRNFLKKWKSLSAIRDLGLLDKNIYASIKERSDLEGNIKKSAGMLTYILTKIPPFEYNNRPYKFTKNKDDPKICHQCIYDFFFDVFSDEHPNIYKSDRTYPGDSTFKNYLKEMHEYFEKKVIQQN